MPVSAAIQRAIESPDYALEIKMPLFSKARPRLTRGGHAYMPEAYRAAQAEMRRQIREQWPGYPLEGPLALYLEIHGEARGDCDNILGAILDAAGPSKSHHALLWTDDRLGVIPVAVVEWVKASKAESKWVLQIADLGVQ
jgi:Holliday junction resolvase RusA-like endonuclease